MKKATCYYWIFFLLATLSAQAETIQRSAAADLIDMSIETSRPQPTAGTGLGIISDIKNVSETTIYLKAEALDMVLPPELGGKTNSPTIGWYAFFPTEFSNNSNDLWDTTIILKPGDSYRAFWAVKPDTLRNSVNFLESIWYVFVSEMNFMFFSPGDYKVSVVGKYWTAPGYSDTDYRTLARSTVIHVSAPQFVILTGAALGGLIAYFILPQGRTRLVRHKKEGTFYYPSFFRFLSRASVELMGMLGSVLLSAIITILLSRISETQFLIRVTINDFWGAIAIGFVANYGGAKLLEKILTDSSPTSGISPQSGNHP